MSRRNSKRSSETRSEIPLQLVTLIPSVAFKAGWAFLKFKRARNKGVRTFRKELKKSGMSEEHIEQLTGQYEELGRIRSYLQDFGLSDVFGMFG